jgi:monoamine oxidase
MDIYDTVVVGGGFGGLYTASMLPSSKKVAVLERSNRWGGRMCTEYNTDGGVEFEMGAWRVPFDERHRESKELFQKLGIHLLPGPRKELPKGNPPAPSKHGKPPPQTAPSEIAHELLACRTKSGRKVSKRSGAGCLRSVGQALKDELQSGYHGLWDQPFNPNRHKLAYSSRLDTGFGVPESGFSSLINALFTKLEGDGCHLRNNVVVTDVSRNESSGLYCVACMGGPVYMARRVVVAVPPVASRQWPSYFQNTQLVHACVKSLPLCHVYAQVQAIYANGSPGESEATHFMLPDSVLQQVSLSPYKNKTYVQVAYASGRLANFWRDLHLGGTGERLEGVINEQLSLATESEQLPFRSLAVVPGTVKLHYWHSAVHMFRPGVGFDLEAVVSKCMRPNPFKLPQVYLVGEAFSEFQGWMQGCVQTAKGVLGLMSTEANRVVYRAPNTHTIHINGRSVDVRQWVSKHPGGKAAICNHIKDPDAIESVLRVQHSQSAMATMLYLSVQ